MEWQTEMEKVKLTMQTSNKITAMQFLCSLIIVLRHSRNLEDFMSGGGIPYLFKGKGSIFILALPTFFFLTGYLFFLNYTLTQYWDKIKKRIRSLLVPYLVFNTVLTCYGYLLVAIQHDPLPTNVVEDVLKGILLHRYNGVFWYVQQIMIYMLIAPLFYFLLNKKRSGILTLVVLILLQRIDGVIPIIRVQHVIFYAFGAWIALNYPSLLNRTFNKKQILLCGVGLTLMIMLHYFFVQEESTTEIIFKMIMIALFWCVCDNFGRMQLPEYVRWSFFIYAMHSPVEKIVNKVFSKILPHTVIFGYINMFGGATITVVMIVLCGYLLKKHLPKVWSTINGGRI